MEATSAAPSVREDSVLSRFRIGDWTVDSNSCYLSQGEESVKLEPKVMEVLVFPAARPGEVVSREALEGSVWAGTVVGYDTVTGAIQKLRRAFRDNSRQPRIIETLSKKGYRLVAPVVPLTEARGRFTTVAEKPPGASAWPSPSIPLLSSIVVALFIAVSILVFKPWTAGIKDTSTLPSRPKSIAVLPFDNLSGDPTFHLGQAYYILHRYDEAIEAFQQGLSSNPASERLRVWLAAAYAQAGISDEAEWQADQILTLNPDFSIERMRETFPFKDTADLEHFQAGLIEAGLPH